jgi:hypothetical protein
MEKPIQMKNNLYIESESLETTNIISENQNNKFSNFVELWWESEWFETWKRLAKSSNEFDK